MRPATRRLAGATRYDTARLMAQQLGSASAYVVQATDWPSAVAVSGLAALTKAPILLVDRTTVPAVTSQALAALGTIRRGWEFGDEPVAVDPRTKDLVFRGVGRPGIVLIGEGPAGRVDKLLESERKRTTRVLPTVPIVVLQVGHGAGQVELRSLPRTVQRLKPALTKQEVAEVSKRMRALGATRLPVPKGVDPMRARPDHKGMRGR